MRARALLVLALLTASLLAGCTDQRITPPSQRTCPAETDGFLAIAVQTGGLDPHPEVFTVQADGTAAGIVLSHGQPAEGEQLGVPDRALHNITETEVRDQLKAAGVPSEGTWNVSLAFQATGNRTAMEQLCQALTSKAPTMDRAYPDEACRDGTTLRLTVWTQGGVAISEAECEAGQGTAFEDVALGIRGVVETARERSGAPS